LSKKLLTMVAVGLMLGSGPMVAVGTAAPLTINFEDLTTRNNFFALGINTTYQGFQWGVGSSGGFAAAVIPGTSVDGWASQTVTDPASGTPPTGGSGTSSAWNWDGLQSLWIAFGSPVDVTDAKFGVLSRTYGSNASTIQMFGYGAGGNLIGTSGVLGLTDTFQTLGAGFTGTYFLEMRANANGQWFSVDDIRLDQTTVPSVPEPASLLLFGTGLVGLRAWKKRRQ
jgi:hypothetical protein